jgi:hypothetical protein
MNLFFTFLAKQLKTKPRDFQFAVNVFAYAVPARRITDRKDPATGLKVLYPLLS